MGWFKTEEIDENTFAISEYGHWEEVHSYLLIGDTRALLIDTGLGIGNIKEEVEKLTNLPIIVVSTHIHWDHIGGHSLFESIYVHENEEQWLREGLPIPLEVVKRNLTREVDINTLPKWFDINNYKVFKGRATRVLTDGDVINIGSRRVRVIHTPGHSPGHMCFLEEERGYLFTGDLIYEGTLYAFYESTDPVRYKQSVERLARLEGIRRIFPAHHKLNISTSLIKSVREAFEKIEIEGLLKHGSGEFKFGGFRIKI